MGRNTGHAAGLHSYRKAATSRDRISDPIQSVHQRCLGSTIDSFSFRFGWRTIKLDLTWKMLTIEGDLARCKTSPPVPERCLEIEQSAIPRQSDREERIPRVQEHRQRFKENRQPALLPRRRRLPALSPTSEGQDRREAPDAISSLPPANTCHIRLGFLECVTYCCQRSLMGTGKRILAGS